MRATLLPLLGMLLLAQCKKKEPTPLATLPAETQTGAGTFGCFINGEVYAAPDNISTSGDWLSQTRLTINGSLNQNNGYTGNKASISLVLNGSLSSATTFSIIPAGAFTPGINQFFAFTSAPNNAYYSGAYIKAGQVTLTKFDGAARIASGRFAFTLYEQGKADTLRITNGRFDVKF